MGSAPSTIGSILCWTWHAGRFLTVAAWHATCGSANIIYNNPKLSSTGAIIALLIYFSSPVLLHLIGFARKGPRGNSIASKIQSRQGNVSSGSMFARTQRTQARRRG